MGRCPNFASTPRASTTNPETGRVRKTGGGGCCCWATASPGAPASSSAAASARMRTIILASPVTLTSLADIEAAAARISGVARRTPLVDLTIEMQDRLPARNGRAFHVKCENLQPMGAFKIRGAFNMLARLMSEPGGAPGLPGLKSRPTGVITYSSGNHGQAVAMAAARLGVQAVVVMPTTAPPNKIAGAKALGAEVILEGTTSIARRARAEKEAEARGLVM